MGAMARPPKDPADKASKDLRIRSRPDDYELYRQAAEYAGLSLSSWARERLLKAARAELKKRGAEDA